MKISEVGSPGAGVRTPLTRERVVSAAIVLADREGIESISMRRLAQELGVEAMSLYTHVRSKNDLLSGVADAVIGQIPVTAEGRDWKASLRQLMLGARTVMLSHPWAPGAVEGQAAPGPAALRYVNTFLGVLREGGSSHASRQGPGLGSPELSGQVRSSGALVRWTRSAATSAAVRWLRWAAVASTWKASSASGCTLNECYVRCTRSHRNSSASGSTRPPMP